MSEYTRVTINISGKSLCPSCVGCELESDTIVSYCKSYISKKSINLQSEQTEQALTKQLGEWKLKNAKLHKALIYLHNDMKSRGISCKAMWYIDEMLEKLENIKE